ncbi:MAG TPA: hypothetical protein VGH09_05380 [Solirubrobacteraceae bacterium]
MRIGTPAGGHPGAERVAQRVEGDPSIAPAAVTHAGGLHRGVEADAHLGGVIWVSGLRVAVDEVVIALVERSLEVTVELAAEPVCHR